MTPPSYYRQVGDPHEDEDTKPGVTCPLLSEEFALGQLRHLFQLMVQGRLRTQAHIEKHARHVLGPAIEALETHHAARSAGGLVR